MLDYLYGYTPYDELNVALSTVSFNGGVSIYIDLQSVYKRLFSQGIVIESSRSLVANVLNLAGHWRHYFKSRLGRFTRIFLINTISSGDSINDIQNNGTDIFAGVGPICKYIPDCYYIHVNNDLNFSVLTYRMIMDKNLNHVNNTNLILTNDEYAYQLPSVMNTYVYRLSSRNIIDANNAVSLWRRKAYLADFNIGILPLLMAYSHDSKLKLPKYYDIRKTTKLLRDHIANGDIRNGYNNPLAIKDVLDADTEQIAIDEEFTLAGRYKKCDLIQQFHDACNTGKFIINPVWQIKKYVDIRKFANAIDKTFNATGNVVNVNFLFDT